MLTPARGRGWPNLKTSRNPQNHTKRQSCNTPPVCSKLLDYLTTTLNKNGVLRARLNNIVVYIFDRHSQNRNIFQCSSVVV